MVSDIAMPAAFALTNSRAVEMRYSQQKLRQVRTFCTNFPLCMMAPKARKRKARAAGGEEEGGGTERFFCVGLA